MKLFKKIINKILLVAILVIITFVAQYSLVSAAGGSAQDIAQQGLGDTATAANFADTDLPTAMGKILSTIVVFSGIILLIVTVYGGILWMTAGGDPEQVSKSKRTIINGVIGMIMCMLAFYFSAYVVEKIGSASIVQ